MKKKIIGALLVALSIQGAYAADQQTQTDLSGFAFYQVGQIENADQVGSAYQKAWDQRYGVRLIMDAQVSSRLKVVAGADFTLWSAVGGTQFGNGSNTVVIIPKQGEGIYTFDPNPANTHPCLQVECGYFPIKYDAEATNFGEYLFSARTGTYPQYIITDFDNDLSTLLGLHISSTLPCGLKQDLLFTSEMLLPPYGDFSLAYMAGYQVGKVLDFGGGVSLNRLVPIDPLLTTVHAPSEVAYNSSNLPVVKSGDTLYYTKQGVKLMVRAAFDPKSHLPSGVSSQLGPQDGKIYFESAILGVEDYGTLYNNIWQRNPRMVGFDFPTFSPFFTSQLGFGLLDILSLEGEYFNSPYYNDLYNIQQTARPDPLPTAITAVAGHQYHWSVFAIKELTKGLSIRALVGKDHYLGYVQDNMGNPLGQSLMNGNNTWHYDVKFMVAF